MRYQQLYRNGTTEGSYQRDCIPRYELIANFCKRYSRPFTTFDLGCNYGYFSFRLADEFDCVSVMADTKDISSLCEENNGRFIWLNRRFSVEDLRRLSSSEHFDLVLAFNVLHHFGNEWRSAAEAVIKMGDYILVEIPSSDDPGTLNDHIAKPMYDWFINRGEVIAETPSHVSGQLRPTILIKGNPGIKTQTIDAPERSAPPVDVNVSSTDKSKTITIRHKMTTENRDYIPGINLWNARLLNVCWPRDLKGMVNDAILTMDGWHDDLRPWNFIIDGKDVHPIDTDNKEWRHTPEIDGLDKCLGML